MDPQRRLDSQRQPIGYWLKRVDRLIDESFDRRLSDQGLHRRHWQILNILRSAPTDADGLEAALRPFWTDDSVTFADVIEDLEHRGWVACRADGEYTLTAAGEGGHSEVEKLVLANRAVFMQGVTMNEYANVIATLSRIAGNLEDAA